MSNNLHETARALSARSRDARRLLMQAREKLGSARTWGIWDMLGGGSLVGLAKHSRINGAMRLVDQARPMLLRIGKDLSRLGLDAQIQPGVGTLTALADFFLDGIFADAYVQSKIRNLQQQIDETLRQLDRVDAALRPYTQA